MMGKHSWLSILLAISMAHAQEVADIMRFWDSGMRGYKNIKHNKWRRGKPKRR